MLILIFSLLQRISLSCSKYDGDYLKLVAQQQEKITFDTSQLINDQYDYLNYKLIDQDNLLQLQGPIHKIESNIFDVKQQQQNVISLKGQHNKDGDWSNYFALLRIQENNYEILYTSNPLKGGQDRLPKFDKSVIIDQTENIKCFDFIIVKSSQFIVDCHDLQGDDHKDFFYVVTINTETEEISITSILNNYAYSLNQNRKLEFSSTKGQEYLYRITQNILSLDNSIEIFSLNLKDDQISNIFTINKQFFIDQQLTNQYPQYVNFMISDLKIDYNSLNIVVIDPFGNLFSLIYDDDQKWQFKIIYHETIFFNKFDYTFKNSDFVIQTKNKLIVSQSKNIQSIDFKEDITSYKPQFTKSFILLKNDETLILIYSTLIIYSLPGQYQLDFYDQQQNDFLIIENNSINRYYLENNLKIVFYPTEQSDLKVHQANLQYKDCTIKLEYQAIEPTNSQLIQIRNGKNIFSEEGFMSLPIQQQVTFSDYVIGPNKKIQLLNVNDTQNNNLMFEQDVEIDVSLISESQDINFLKIIYQEDSLNSYIILIQTPLELNIRTCSFINQQQFCYKFYKFLVNYELNNQNSVFEYVKNFLNIYILKDNNQIWQIQIDATYGDLNQILRSLSFSVDNIGLAKQFLIFWSFNSDFILVINKGTLYENYQVSTLYNQVFCNKYSNTIYIYSSDTYKIDILLLTLSNIYLQYRLTLNQETVDINVLFQKNTFSLFKKQNNGKIISQIWNKEDEMNIYLIKELPMYNFEIYVLNDISQSQTDSIIYIKSKSKLLIYYIDQPNHNSLHNVVNIDENIQQLQGILGLLFFINDYKLKLYSFNYLNLAKYSFELENQVFKSSLQCFVSFTNNQNNIKLEQQLKIFNSNTQISLDISKLKIQTNLTSSNQNNFIQDMGTDWYQGLVTDINVINGNGASIIQQINLQQEKFIETVSSIEDFDDETLISIYYNFYTLVSKKDAKEIKKFQFEKLVNCYEFLYAQKQSFIVNCLRESQPIIVSIVCEGQVCSNSQGLSLEFNIVKTFVFNNQLFLMYEDSIKAYLFKDSLLNIDQSEFQGQISIQKTNYGYVMNQIKENYYHLYYFDRSGNFLIDELSIQQNILKKFNTLKFNLYTFLNQEYLMNDLSSMRKIIIKSSQYENNSLIINFIFFQYYGVHYGIQFNFQCNTEQCIIKEQKINYILQGYPQLNLFDKFTLQLSIRQNKILIPYEDQRNNHNFIVSYQLPSQEVENVNQPMLFNGVVRLSNTYPVALIMKTFMYQQQMYLLLNLKNQLNLMKFQINDSPKLVLDGKFINSTNITVEVKNDYFKQFFSVTININEDDSKEKSLLWLWILLGILGGILVCGLGFYFYRKKRNNVQDQLIQ